MPFETFRRQRLKTSNSPEVTIQRKGIFSLNKAAYEALEAPESVELLYDSEEKLVGIRKVSAETDHAYSLRSLGRGSTHLVSGTAFTRWYGIETPVSKRWPAVLNDGLLVIDLKEPGVVTASNRSKKTETK